MLRDARERALANQDVLADEAFDEDDQEEEALVRPREAYRRPAGRTGQARQAAAATPIQSATIHGRGRAQP
ncbi:MAG: hypothetical protein ACRDOB_18715, partial [Streptosporangiaceae bacterium]